MDRRAFIGSGLSALAAASLPRVVRAAAKPAEYRGFLLHLTSNMWGDYSIAEFRQAKTVKGKGISERLYLDESNLVRTVDHAVAGGCNLLMLDVGDAVVYPSHPEIALPDSWQPERLQKLVRRFRSQGLEVIPKLNFSATHDSWLKEYHKALTTPKYYRVCADLIRDAAEIFGRPKGFHIGMDEESFGHQWKYDFIVLRQRELWWHDFNFLAGECERNGMRCWTWCSVGYDDLEGFVRRLPKGVLPTTGLYDEELEGFDMAKLRPKMLNYKCLKQMLLLDEAGFEQVPCVSNWLSPTQQKAGMKENAHATAGVVKFCREHLKPELVRGFLAAPWSQCVTDAQYRYNCRGWDLLADALKEGT